MNDAVVGLIVLLVVFVFLAMVAGKFTDDDCGGAGGCA